MIRGLLLLAMAAHAQTVQGVTVNSATHKPVAGAMVQLISAAPEEEAGAELEIYRGHSDEAGRFRFDGVAPGHYRAIADAPGFTRANLAGRVARVSVARGAMAPVVTIAMTPAAVISGRVVDQDGDPIAYASVEALQYGYQSGKKSLQQIGNARSDDRGEYRIFGIMPGRYYVRAQMRAGAAATYSPTFFPGERVVAQASLLEAPAGGELHSIDIMLHQEELHNLTGKVVDGQTGQAAGNVYVMARTADGFANGGAQIADSFTIHGLMPGRYVLTAQESGGAAGRTARQVVDVGSADLTGVVLTLTAGLEVAGTVRTGSEVPEDPTKIHFFLQGEDANVEGHVNANGAFTFHNVRPDHYHLLWNIPKGTYVKSIKLGDRLLADDGVDLTGLARSLGHSTGHRRRARAGRGSQQRRRACGGGGGHDELQHYLRRLDGHQRRCGPVRDPLHRPGRVSRAGVRRRSAGRARGCRFPQALREKRRAAPGASQYAANGGPGGGGGAVDWASPRRHGEHEESTEGGGKLD